MKQLLHIWDKGFFDYPNELSMSNCIQQYKQTGMFFLILRIFPKVELVFSLEGKCDVFNILTFNPFKRFTDLGFRSGKIACPATITISMCV